MKNGSEERKKQINMATAVLQIGQRVIVIGKNFKATVQYIGEPKFAPGKWIGIVLDEPQVYPHLLCFSFAFRLCIYYYYNYIILPIYLSTYFYIFSLLYFLIPLYLYISLFIYISTVLLLSIIHIS